MRNAVGLLVGLCGVLVACKLGDSTPAGNCNARDNPENEFCFEYPKSEVANAPKTCVDFKGTWSAGACDRTGALGACKLSTGITKVFYKGTKFPTEDDAKLKCMGDWVSGAGK